MDSFGFDPASYALGIHLFIRLLGVIYIIAYVPFFFQAQGLFGQNGIRPIPLFLDAIRSRFGKARWYYVPTLFWLQASDRAILLLVTAGVLFGILLMCGVCPPLMLLLLYVTHLSLTSAGQEFLRFGWETYLLELTIGAFLVISCTPFGVCGWIGLNLLLLRFHVQAGASKLLSGDPHWRDCTALAYHYQTQPLPNTMAYYFHKLPLWFHKLCVLGMFYIELVVPFAIFMPAEIRCIVFIQLALFQMSIWFTGNLSYLNHLTVVSCVFLLHNQYLEGFIHPAPIQEYASPYVWKLFIEAVGLFYLLLQMVAFIYPFFKARSLSKILAFVEPFHVAYPHGIFAVMTTKRYEIIIEGSDDGLIWKEYEFYFKPGSLSRRPKRVAPYQPRLDWQAWFLPFAPFQFEYWFQSFLIKLLQGSKPVAKLIQHNPFPDAPPRYVRALVYDYTFTTLQEKKETGNWWKREFVQLYSPQLSLRT
jgi:hypothetical protein